MIHAHSRAELNCRQITLILVDNHPVVREGLALITSNQKDMKVVAQGNDGSRPLTFTIFRRVEAVDLYHIYKPDVTVLDLSMPNMNGAQATVEILNRIQQLRFSS